MRQIAYPAAVGTCMAGVGVTPLRAAEWLVIPIYSATADYDSNRRLAAERKDSEAAVVTADLSFKRAQEDWDITIEPRYALRRFSDTSLGNGDDRSLFAALNRNGERSLLNLTASYWDQSTLLTEVFETGIISANTHRHQSQAAASWNWTQTERRQLVSQLSYTDVSYYGQGRAFLPGYRYPVASVGERFGFSEKGSVTASVFGSALASDSRGNSSHEEGVQVQVIYAFSERDKLDATLGESSRVLASQSSHGTDASVSLSHQMILGSLGVTYTRSLVPYGTGFLVERQQATALATRSLTPYLDANLSLSRIDNNRAAVVLSLDRRNYDIASTALTWHVTEFWACSAQLQGVHTQTAGLSAIPVNEWRTSVNVTWSPLPWTRSR